MLINSQFLKVIDAESPIVIFFLGGGETIGKYDNATKLLKSMSILHTHV